MILLYARLKTEIKNRNILAQVDCYSKIFQSESKKAKIIWTIFCDFNY